MSKRTKAKHKICRRQMAPVCGSTSCPVHAKNYTPGQHGPNGRRGIISDYGKQLRAKQQLKKSYGNITEKQFRSTYKEAIRLKGDTSENLVGLLEFRLDSAIFRSNFVPSVHAARQFVNHKHLTVNGVKANIASYRLKIGDVIQIKEKSLQIPMVIQSLQGAQSEVPEYLKADHKKGTIEIIRIPKLEDIPYSVVMEPHLVIEFYSR